VTAQLIAIAILAVQAKIKKYSKPPK
jgi:hypothetical protein